MNNNHQLNVSVDRDPGLEPPSSIERLSGSNAESRLIVRIKGGLGNQLFMYAAARRLSLMGGLQLKIDSLSGFPRDRWRRSYLLHHFNIQAPLASKAECYFGLGGQLRRQLGAGFANLVQIAARRYLKEESLSFDPRIKDLQLDHSIYMEGYWQSEKYFEDISNILRDDLKVVTDRSDKAKRFADEVRDSKSVALHVRRLSPNPRLGESEPYLLEPEYYSKAIDTVRSEVQDARFFCFGDNLEWIRTWMPTELPVIFVSEELQGCDSAIEDFWLMSQCKHHIVANSTFSWWSAWLCDNPSKIVYAPDPVGRRWHTADHLPSTWRAI